MASDTLPNLPTDDTAPADGATPVDTAAHAPRIAGYEIVERIGIGGMGVVWRAIQRSTSREVALKVMSAAPFGSERGRRRFEREVELTARLEHPHVARVYDSGIDHGLCFYVMEL